MGAAVAHSMERVSSFDWVDDMDLRKHHYTYSLFQSDVWLGLLLFAGDKSGKLL